MNTNNNVYTIVYTTIIVVIAAAILAVAAMALKPKQDANIKAETISQMLTAAGFSSKEDMAKLGNDQILKMYSDNIKTAFLIDAKGDKTGELETAVGDIELQDNLKVENKNIAAGNPQLPVYVFTKDGAEIIVIPIYGAGLWGPVWGYIALQNSEGQVSIAGAYFDHESETAGLGAKIKDDPAFQAEFIGEQAFFGQDKVFAIVKGGAPKDAEGKSLKDNQIDAITGATMTSQGLDAAIDTWLAAYAKYFIANAPKECCGEGEGEGTCCEEPANTVEE